MKKNLNPSFLTPLNDGAYYDEFTHTRHAAMRLPLQIILACVNAV